jgi:hypothetical protein
MRASDTILFKKCLSFFKKEHSKFIISQLNKLVFENTKDIFRLMNYNKELYRDFLKNETVWFNTEEKVNYGGHDNDYITIHNGDYYYEFDSADALDRYIITLTGIIDYSDEGLNDPGFLGCILIGEDFTMIGLLNGFIATNDPYE